MYCNNILKAHHYAKITFSISCVTIISRITTIHLTIYPDDNVTYLRSERQSKVSKVRILKFYQYISGLFLRAQQYNTN